MTLECAQDSGTWCGLKAIPVQRDCTHATQRSRKRPVKTIGWPVGRSRPERALPRPYRVTLAGCQVPVPGHRGVRGAVPVHLGVPRALPRTRRFPRAYAPAEIARACAVKTLLNWRPCAVLEGQVSRHTRDLRKLAWFCERGGGDGEIVLQQGGSRARRG